MRRPGRSQTSRSLALVVAAALAAATFGCGSSGSDSSESSSTGAGSSASTTTASGPTTTVAVDVRKGISYGTDDGQDLTLTAFVPDGDGTDRPAIVLVHGGGWSSGDSEQVAPDAEAFAAAGFVSFSIDYVLDDDGKGRGWPDELVDLFEALAWVSDNAESYGVDPTRIGVYGSSAGGNLAMLAATRRDGAKGPAPKAVVSWSGPTDLTTLTPPTLEPGDTPSTTASAADAPSGCQGDPICIGILDPTAMVEYLGCALDECRSDYEDASPVTHVGGDSPPTYLVSFEEDLVPLAQQKAMVAKLEAAGVAHDLLVVDGEGHAEEARPEALGPSIEWFRQHL